MAWTKAKKISALVAVLLVAGIATMCFIHRSNQYQGPSHFPKSAWASAGFGGPVSALETACWAAQHGEGKTMLASITPELEKPLEKAWEESAKTNGVTLEDFFASHAREDVSVVLGFRILGVRLVNDHEARVHVYVQGWWCKATFVMQKIGPDWKVQSVEWL